MLDKENDKRLMEQYQLGNAAKRALEFFGDWMTKRKEKLTREMLAASTADAAIPFWNKLKLLEELERDIYRDIQTGELALLEMEEQNG